MTTKADRLGMLVPMLTRAIDLLKWESETEVGEACLMIAATFLEKYTNRDTFLERACVWWDQTVRTELEVPPAPKTETLRASLEDMAVQIRCTLPPGAAFVLVVRPFAAGDSLYMSSLGRQEALDELRALTARIEQVEVGETRH